MDIIITGCLFYFLRKFRRRFTSSESMMIHVVDTLTLYTLENGLLTRMTTTASLICWLKMPTNLVFLGLHFVIGKLYANSLLASLNTRKALRDMRSHMQPWPRDPNYPILTGDDFPRYPDQQYSVSFLQLYWLAACMLTSQRGAPSTTTAVHQEVPRSKSASSKQLHADRKNSTS
ncbi:hypothetical protein C8J56DRAFT_37419 [Mycena floridula]|nr:hypothetical protein C8J56DRAFT_37419 [Mycena floridula]